MCFGIRILSSFHLCTLQITIQNLKCLKNAIKNTPRHNFLHIRQKWSLYCAVFASAVQIQSVLAGTTIHEAHQIVCCNALYCDCDMWSELKLIRKLKYFFFKACSASTSLEYTRNSLDSSVISGHALVACLGNFRFWISICNVPSWNKLKILIPKHMWKC